MSQSTFTAVLTEVDGPMFSYVIRISPETTAIFRQPKGAVRVLCSIKNAKEFPCALNPRGEEYVIIVSKALIKKCALEPGIPFSVNLRSDPNEGLLLPEELLEALLQDDRGSLLFEALLPGRKRGLIHYIRSAKTIDTRIKRALEIIAKLKQETGLQQKPA